MPLSAPMVQYYILHILKSNYMLNQLQSEVELSEFTCGRHFFILVGRTGSGRSLLRNPDLRGS